MFSFLIVAESKALWKKAKDSRRYIVATKTKKNSKSGDAAPDFEDDEGDMDNETRSIRDEMAFMDEATSSKFRETFSIGGLSVGSSSACGQSEQFDDTIDTGETGTETATSSYSYMAKKKRAISTSNDAAEKLSQSIVSFIDKRQAEDNKMQHMETWKQLEKMYEQLDNDKITDLNFSFVSQTYAAIVAKRNI